MTPTTLKSPVAPVREKVKYDKTRAHQVYKTREGVKVPGCTTITGLKNKPALLHWAWKLGMEGKDYKKVSGQAADIGSLAHFMVQCHLLGKDADTSEFSKNDIDKAENAFLAFLGFWDREELEMVGEPEVQLVSERFLYGGTLDLLARRKSDGKLGLLDWKSSKAIYDDHVIQIAGYEKLQNDVGERIHWRKIVRIDKETGESEVHNISDNQISCGWDAFQGFLRAYYAIDALKGVM